MKTPIFLLTILASAAIGGTVVYLLLASKAPQTPVAVSVPVASGPRPIDKFTAPPAQPAQAVAVNPQPAAPVAVTNPPADSTTNSEAAIAFRKTIDALLDPHTTGQQKHDLFQQLAKAGQLNQAIAELQQRALNDPTNPEIPTTLGEAQLNQLRALKEAGADINEIGILAMQADQSFNAALKIDPSNWEAQFVKSASMYYWPADPTRDGQVVQTLSSLIDQQGSLPSQPEFAQTYLVLGNEYQKIGQPDKAIATWRIGLQNFPNNTELQQKINSQ